MARKFLKNTWAESISALTTAGLLQARGQASDHDHNPPTQSTFASLTTPDASHPSPSPSSTTAKMYRRTPPEDFRLEDDRVLEGHIDSVNCLALSRDGRLAASASDDRTIRLWNLETGLPEGIRQHSFDSGFVNDIAFAPSGFLLASACNDKLIRLTKTHTGEVVHQMAGHADWVLSICFRSDGERLVSGSRDCTVRIWNPTSGRSIGKPLRAHSDSVHSVSLSHDGLSIVSGSADKTIRVWDLEAGTLIRTITGHTGSVYAVSFSPDDRLVVSGSQDQFALVWDWRTGEPFGHGSKYHARDTVYSVAFSPDGTLIASGTSDGNIHVSDYGDGLHATRLQTRDAGSVNAVIWTLDGQRLLGCFSNSLLRVIKVTQTPATVQLNKRMMPPPLPPRTSSSSLTARTLELPPPIAVNSMQSIPPPIPPRRYRAASPQPPTEAKLPAVDTQIAHNTNSRVGSSSTVDTQKQKSGKRTNRPHPHPPPPSPTEKVSEPSARSVVPSGSDGIDRLWTHLKGQSADFSDTSSLDDSKIARDWSGHLLKGVSVGGGGFGDVFMGVWTNLPRSQVDTPPTVVIKCLRPHLSATESIGAIKKLNREVKVWLSLQHPNIVPFIGITHDFAESKATPALISLWMPNGSLRSYLHQNPSANNTAMLKGFAHGVGYLHQFNPSITHGDINAGNILVDQDGTLRLTDFGLSRMLTDETLWLTTATTAMGTVRWMAPELLNSEQATVTKQSDMYAFAMTIVEIFTGDRPFYNMRMDGAVATAVVLRDDRPSRPYSMKEAWLWNIVKGCWVRDPAKRLVIDQVISEFEANL